MSSNTVVSYLHPHMETRVNDNSTVVNIQTTPEEGTVTYMPYFSDRGVDGVIEKYTSYSKFIADHGTPNFKKHGQPIYNVLQFLSGGGVVYAKRLVPENAAAAQIKIKSVVKKAVKSGEATATPAEVVGRDIVISEDEDTHIGGDLLTITCKGKGAYGNKLTVKLEKNDRLSTGYNKIIYNLSLIENNNIIEGPYIVSLCPEATTVSGMSLYIKNVIEQYSSNIDVTVNETLYESLVLELGSENNDLLKLNDSGELFELAGGKDGDKLTEESRDTLISGAFATDAKGNDIRNKKQFPIDVLLDANFGTAGKGAIKALAAERGDCFCYMDCTSEATTKALAIEKAGTNNNRCVAVYGQPFVVHDTFTNSDINVTMTYFLAYKIPVNDSQYGIQYPLAGPNRGVINGFKSMAFNPTSSEKEELYTARVNYAEQDYRSTKLMSQLTSQDATSALSNINNMRVLLKMIRNVEEISENYFFEFANSTVLSHFEQAVNSYLSEWVNNGACTVCQGTVYQNDYDVVQRIVRVSIEVVFTGIIERIVIEFNVGSDAE